MPYLVIIVVYSIAQIALGVWVARQVKGSSDFFVAGRALGPGLLFATFLAANIGAGSTIGATGLGYRDGLAAVWWVLSAGVGSIVLALWVGPRIRRLAAHHDLKTVGDFLEWRYDRRVRFTIGAILWVGTVCILAGQLMGIAWILTVVIGIPKLAGCALGALVITTYFAAGGLKSSAVVNVVQLTVKLAGFAAALPLALSAAGGLAGLHATITEPGMWNVWSNGPSGWIYVAMLGPNFVVSPGLLQKVYGARDDRAVRIGVGVNAVCLILYAVVPVLLGMSARALHPDLANADREMALPLLFMHDLPFAIGALGLAAVFSAEVSASDAILFMLSTSLSQDLYKRFVNPAASDRQVVFVARMAAIAGALAAATVAMLSKSVVDALGFFYTLVGVGLFVPIIAGLYSRRPGAAEALAAIAGGVLTAAAVRLWYGGGPLPLPAIGFLTPALCGLSAAAAAFALAGLFTRRRT